MNQSIAPGPIPPVPGLEKEEPELANEEDIPSDDGQTRDGRDPSEPSAATQERPLRDVERE